jgi:predicted dehydrogenase
VEVVAICGRSAAPTHDLASRLGVPAHLAWRDAIRDLHPDIVTIATPAASHVEIAIAAAAAGCHVLCEKPMALDAGDAATMLAAVRHAGVRHAYAPASCLSPAIELARDLLADGLIGALTDVESTHHAGWGLPRPGSWIDDLSLGGGALNNIFTHKLAQVLRVTGGTPRRVMGEARNFRPRVPIGPRIHDFRELFQPLTPAEADAMEWRAADADTSYSIIMGLALPSGGAVSARFEGGATSKSRTPAALTLYGLGGTLVLTGGNEMSPRALHHYDYARDSWQELRVPSGDAALETDDIVQQDWNLLAQHFVADILSKGHGYYPTFDDGSLAAKIAGVVRDGGAESGCWTGSGRPYPAPGADAVSYPNE